MYRSDSSTPTPEASEISSSHPSHRFAEKLQRLLPRVFIILGLTTLTSTIFSAATINQKTWIDLRDFPAWCLLLGVLICTMPLFTHTLRLWIWTSFLKLQFSFKQLFHISVASEVTAAALPAIIGGNGTRVAMLIAQGTPPGIAASLGMLGTLEDLAFFLIALPLAVVLAPATFSEEGGYLFSHLHELPLASLSVLEIIGFLAVISGGILLLKNFAPMRWRQNMLKILGTLGEWLRQCKSTFRLLIARGKWRFVLAVALAALQWASRYCVLGLLLWGLELAPNFLEIFFTQWVVFTLMNLVPSPGATGGAEVTFALMYKSFIPHNLLGVMGAAWRVFTFTLPVALATLVLILLTVGRKKSGTLHTDESKQPEPRQKEQPVLLGGLERNVA